MGKFRLTGSEVLNELSPCALRWVGVCSVVLWWSIPILIIQCTQLDTMVRIKMSRCELRKEPHLVQVVTLNYLIHRVTKISSTAVNTWRLTFDVIVSFQREANWVKSLFKSYIKTVRKQPTIAERFLHLWNLQIKRRRLFHNSYACDNWNCLILQLISVQKDRHLLKLNKSY